MFDRSARVAFAHWVYCPLRFAIASSAASISREAFVDVSLPLRISALVLLMNAPSCLLAEGARFTKTKPAGSRSRIKREPAVFQALS
jgi:hypothetical protein